MSALGRVVRAGVGRRRVQTAVMIMTTLMAVTASFLAAGLLVASQAPFDHAFAQQRGAHLTARFDGAKVTAAELTATAHAKGVTAAAGPFRTVAVRARTASSSDILPEGVDLPPVTVMRPGGGRGRCRPGRPRLRHLAHRARPDRGGQGHAARRTGHAADVPRRAGQPHADRGRSRPVGDRHRGRLGDPRAGRVAGRAGRRPRVRDALPSRRRGDGRPGHHAAGPRSPRRCRRAR